MIKKLFNFFSYLFNRLLYFIASAVVSLTCTFCFHGN